jgi:8-oxo-dGTP pyrophosphatase MutT (NUDIX family)
VNVRNEVQGVIFDGNDRKLVMLVQKRDTRVRRFHWRLLKGGMNKGETKVEALKREILEETGLKNIKVLDQIHSYEFVFRETLHRVSSFLVEANSKDPVRLQESELSDYLWTHLDSADGLLYWANEKEALKKLSQFSNPL